MSSPAAAVATGSSIAFSTTFFAQITKIKHSGISRPALKTSHMGISLAGAGKFGNDTFIPGKLNDPGELEIEGNFNPDTLIPIEGAAEMLTLTIAGATTPATFAGSAFMTDFEWDGPIEGVMTYKAKVKFSGNVTKTSGT